MDWLFYGQSHNFYASADQEPKTKNCILIASGLWSFLLLVGFKMRPQAIDDHVFVALVHLFFHFFQGEVNNVVVMDFQGRDGVAETQPKPVEKVHFVGREVRRVRSEDFVKLVAVGQMDFEVELRLGVAKLFPSFPDLPRLLFI